eukprot:764869-Pleurochrysis_carterae.AAC.1
MASRAVGRGVHTEGGERKAHADVAPRPADEGIISSAAGSSQEGNAEEEGFGQPAMRGVVLL